MEKALTNPCQEVAIFMGAELIGTAEHELPHGSRGTVTVENWKVPQNYPLDLQTLARLGHFHYDQDWNCFMQAWETFRDMQFEDIHDQIVHSDAKDTIGRMIVYRGIRAAFHYLHLYVKWIKTGVPPTDKELSPHKSPD